VSGLVALDNGVVFDQVEQLVASTVRDYLAKVRRTSQVPMPEPENHIPQVPRRPSTVIILWVPCKLKLMLVCRNGCQTYPHLNMNAAHSHLTLIMKSDKQI